MRSGATTRALVTLTLLSLLLPAKTWGQAGGVIEGTLSIGAERTRKTASRYPSGGRSINSMQRVPAVVYLLGAGLGVDSARATVEIVQRDTAFAPGALAIPTGTVVRFPNADPFFHNVYSYASNARFDLGRYPDGESREFIFDEPGIARIFCEVHEFMRAVVVVTDHPFHAVVGEDGTFRMDGVPPGEYRLVAYQPDLGSVDEQVVVTDGRTVSLRLALGG